MSDVMLHGVLRMPPELWTDSPFDVAQRHGRYLQASRRIEDDAQEIERLADENTKLRGFAQAAMECWPSGDLDGGTLQEIATKHGLLEQETRHEPCEEGCTCAEYVDAEEFESGVTCYRKTALLKTPNAGGNSPTRGED